jgi:hypothetical protein
VRNLALSSIRFLCRTCIAHGVRYEAAQVGMEPPGATSVPADTLASTPKIPTEPRNRHAQIRHRSRRRARNADKDNLLDSIVTSFGGENQQTSGEIFRECIICVKI